MPKTKDNKKQYKVPKRRQPVFKVVGAVLKRIFYRKVKVLNLSGKDICEKSIFVSNHAGKHGPMAIEFFMPFNVKWGAHQMLGGFGSRFKYLRDVHYMQELGKNKFVATVRATVEAIFSKMLYKGVKFIGTYSDARFTETVEQSMTVLDNNMSVAVFPENAAEAGGYLAEPEKFLPGFVAVSEQYYKKSGEDVPVYPIYYSHDKKLLIVDRPKYIGEMKKSGMTRDEIAESFRENINSLYREHILADTPV